LWSLKDETSTAICFFLVVVDIGQKETPFCRGHFLSACAMLPEEVL
jgi:hypothetical protein